MFYSFSGGKSNNSMLLSAIVDGSSDLFVIKFNEKPVLILVRYLGCAPFRIDERIIAIEL